jgi:hypothetical protein
MNLNLRFSLIFLIGLLPAVGSSANETIQIKNKDIPLFQGINYGLSSLMDAAGKCRSTDSNLYKCLCAESKALKKMDSALRKALDKNPE